MSAAFSSVNAPFRASRPRRSRPVPRSRPRDGASGAERCACPRKGRRRRRGPTTRAAAALIPGISAVMINTVDDAVRHHSAAGTRCCRSQGQGVVLALARFSQIEQARSGGPGSPRRSKNIQPPRRPSSRSPKDQKSNRNFHRKPTLRNAGQEAGGLDRDAEQGCQRPISRIRAGGHCPPAFDDLGEAVGSRCTGPDGERSPRCCFGSAPASGAAKCPRVLQHRADQRAETGEEDHRQHQVRQCLDQAPGSLRRCFRRRKELSVRAPADGARASRARRQGRARREGQQPLGVRLSAVRCRPCADKPAPGSTRW